MATPKGKIPAKPFGSDKKKKQMSLMSFFKPLTSPLKSESDKENINSTPQSTPLTSEYDQSVSTKNILSSPLTKKSIENTATSRSSLSSNRGEKALVSSPIRAKETTSKKRLSETKQEDNVTAPKNKKRKRIFISDDEDEEDSPSEAEDSADDFVPESAAEEDDMSDFVVDDDAEMLPAEAEDQDDDDEDEEIISKKTKKKSPKKSSSPPLNSTSSTTKQLGSSGLGDKFNSDSSYTGVSTTKPKKPSLLSSAASTKRNFAKENEERYQWLVNIKDAEKRPIGHPEYDARTLYIPSSAWSKFTNFEKQYWEIKSKMWNTVVFFKKGKFYELYENDAIIANTKFDLKIAGGGRANMKLAGIPEMSFDYWAKEFISNGYKVAKVDQKESMLAKEMRGGNSKEEKIIKRELTGVLTGGTLTDLSMLTEDMATYCMSIKHINNNSIDGSKIFGLAFVDTATSEMNLLEIKDDEECTKLATVIAQVRPKELVLEKENLCSIATKILKFNSDGNTIWNYLNSETEFWNSELTLEKLVKSKYYDAEDLDDFSKYPEVLVKYKDSHPAAFSAFGGLLYYLKGLKLDSSIMTLGNFKEYSLTNKSTSTMLLDGITLSNLELLNNSTDGSDKGTLLKLINRAITLFGKRQLKTWILHPLRNISEIDSRYDAVEYLMSNSEFRDQLERVLSETPDLERLIARVHGGTLKFKDFVKVVEGFEKISNLQNILKSYDLSKAGVLQSFVNSFPPQLDECIGSWEDAFDRQQALEDIVVPEPGIDEEFDDSRTKMDDLEMKLNLKLRTYKKEYKSQEICYRDSGKEIYLIEVPVKIKNIPKDWQQMGATSKVKRYWSPEVKKLARLLMEQRETHKMLCDTLKSRMYAKFDVHYKVWLSTVKALADIDCIIALTKASENIGTPSCRPQLIDSENAQVEFKELRHPCFNGNADFIPNDVVLGGSDANFGLLTGANAAGKSTIMRTTALAVILSQIGCYLPCELAQLSTVDRIMTRLGANDNIMQGKSTFFVELSETKKILDNSTSKSLVILDELGRGGSSSDGYAIAESVLYHLATHVQSIGFFATHYGTLGLSFNTHPNVKPLRMAILVEKDSRNITFLYKLEAGAASGSFGMNVASMCGIAEEIVEKAEIAAKDYEHTSKLKKLTESMLHNDLGAKLNLGLQSDFTWLSNNYDGLLQSTSDYNEQMQKQSLGYIFKMIDSL